ncbi:MAG: translocation protein TolB, partial [Chloroflexi bacterium]|nr:translocation protein TolB [Chloroflexota bacterium]
NADGTDYEQFSFPRPFPYLKSDLHWSPDGENIVFEVVQPSSGFNDLFLINADGSNPRQLTFHPASDSEPVWSPDGSQIAFVSMRDGNWEIYTINADGSELTRVTNTPGDETEPAWRPDN